MRLPAKSPRSTRATTLGHPGPVLSWQQCGKLLQLSTAIQQFLESCHSCQFLPGRGSFGFGLAAFAALPPLPSPPCGDFGVCCDFGGKPAGGRPPPPPPPTAGSEAMCCVPATFAAASLLLSELCTALAACGEKVVQPVCFCGEDAFAQEQRQQRMSRVPRERAPTRTGGPKVLATIAFRRLSSARVEPMQIKPWPCTQDMHTAAAAAAACRRRLETCLSCPHPCCCSATSTKPACLLTQCQILQFERWAPHH